MILTKNIQFLPIGPTVAVQREDRTPWMHVTITDYGDNDYNGRSYRIQITKI